MSGTRRYIASGRVNDDGTSTKIIGAGRVAGPKQGSAALPAKRAASVRGPSQPTVQPKQRGLMEAVKALKPRARMKRFQDKTGQGL